MTKTDAPILLVEDTPSLQLLYRSALNAVGHQVIVASTAAEALGLLRDMPVQLVLLDLVLPDREGLDLMQELLQLRPDTAVVVMTAHGSINKAVEAMRAGAHDFLVISPSIRHPGEGRDLRSDPAQPVRITRARSSAPGQSRFSAIRSPITGAASGKARTSSEIGRAHV